MAYFIVLNYIMLLNMELEHILYRNYRILSNIKIEVISLPQTSFFVVFYSLLLGYLLILLVVSVWTVLNSGLRSAASAQLEGGLESPSMGLPWLDLVGLVLELG